MNFHRGRDRDAGDLVAPHPMRWVPYAFCFVFTKIFFTNHRFVKIVSIRKKYFRNENRLALLERDADEQIDWDDQHIACSLEAMVLHQDVRRAGSESARRGVSDSARSSALAS